MNSHQYQLYIIGLGGDYVLTQYLLCCAERLYFSLLDLMLKTLILSVVASHQHNSVLFVPHVDSYSSVLESHASWYLRDEHGILGTGTACVLSLILL